ncbi:MAG: family 31 glucosidase, partial [Lachnospiraceae bacterium]|nr:family 31 glucosidase [Lachnospiraceae bacterium]
MRFEQIGNALVGRAGNEYLQLEPWGRNALRVRCTMLPRLSGEDRALTEKPAEAKAEITIDPNLSVIKNGEIRAEINQSGTIAFFKGDTRILYEYNRFYGVPLTRESR